MRPRIHPPYTFLGRFYDQLTPEAPAMNRHARRRILGPLLPRLRTVCDLGCGTGTTAIELSRAGHTVYAVDASAAQCAQAREKVRRAGVPVRVIRADMRRLRLPEPVDLVLCEFNPLNHLGRKSDLGVAFRAVARALRPGGWFCFDLNMKGTYLHLAPVVLFEERKDFCLVMRGSVDSRRQRGRLELDWFVAGRGGFRRHRERIEDVWWSDAEVRAALRGAGFVRIRAWDGTRVRPRRMKPRRGHDRYYLARKPGPAGR
jgi:SAM-dependent methyltransferase